MRFAHLLYAAFGRILYCRGATPIANERSDVCFLTRSMFVKHFEHKGPRLEARPWLMAAFYNL